MNRRQGIFGFVMVGLIVVVALVGMLYVGQAAAILKPIRANRLIFR